MNENKDDIMRKPLDILDKTKEKRILIKLKSGEEIVGTLKAFDLHLNIWIDDSTINKDDNTVKLGILLIRGDNILFVSPESVI